MTLHLLPFWSLQCVYSIQFMIKMPSTAQFNVGCGDMQNMTLGSINTSNPNNPTFEAMFIAMHQLPPGCGTAWMKLQEYRMLSHSPSLFSRKSRGSERRQLAKPGNCKFPNNFQLALKYLLSIEHCLLLQVFGDSGKGAVTAGGQKDPQQLPEKWTNEKNSPPLQSGGCAVDKHPEMNFLFT